MPRGRKKISLKDIPAEEYIAEPLSSAVEGKKEEVLEEEKILGEEQRSEEEAVKKEQQHDFSQIHLKEKKCKVLNKDSEFLREYSERLHGSDYVKLAWSYAKKIGGFVI